MPPTLALSNKKRKIKKSLHHATTPTPFTFNLHHPTQPYSAVKPSSASTVPTLTSLFFIAITSPHHRRNHHDSDLPSPLPSKPPDHINPDRIHERNLTPSRIFLAHKVYHRNNHERSQLKAHPTILLILLITNSEFIILLSLYIY